MYFWRTWLKFIIEIIVEKFGAMKKEAGFNKYRLEFRFDILDFSISYLSFKIWSAEFGPRVPAFSSREITTSLRRVDDHRRHQMRATSSRKAGRGELSPHDRPHHEHSHQGRFEDVARPLRHHPNWNMHAAYVHLSALPLDKMDK